MNKARWTMEMLEDCGNYCRREWNTARVIFESTTQCGTHRVAKMTALRLGCGHCINSFGSGPQIINWCKPQAYSALSIPGFKALLTDLNTGHSVSLPLREKALVADARGPANLGWDGPPASGLKTVSSFSRCSSQAQGTVWCLLGSI